MVVRSNKSNAFYVLGILLLVILASALFISIGAIIPAFVIVVGTICLLALYCITIGRTFIMDASGCEIIFWKYTRNYAWSNISLKRLEPAHLGLRQEYHNGGVFFSPFPVRKPEWLDPTLYCMFSHPFSCFYVYFVPPDANPQTSGTPGIYEVDRIIFLRQLEEWGVKLI